MEAWAVGSSGSRLRRQSTGWSLDNSGTSRGLSAIWGSSPEQIWAVGESGTILSHNGTTWSTTADSQVTTMEWLTTIWGANRWNTWIGGLNGTLLTYQP